MPRAVKRISKKAGLSPGTIVHVGEKKTEETRIRVIDFTESKLSELEPARVEDAFPYRDTKSVSWINVDGLHDAGLVEKMGRHFRVHPLILEDIVNTGQRPKFEDLGRQAFIVLKMLYLEEGLEIRTEQISLVMGRNFLLSFQEKPGDVFEPVRERIRKAKGRIRKSGTDYLAYALIDSVVDNYFSILETLGERTEQLEEELLSRPKPSTLQGIHGMKRELIRLRRSVWPLREAVSGLTRGESSLIADKTIVYLRDVYDHTIQVIDTVESLRDTVSGMLDTYLSSISNRMNEVMKVLTVIATIFIPLTFIVGVYGMNFDFMPELHWIYGYYVVWLIMASLAMAMVAYFRRKGWL